MYELELIPGEISIEKSAYGKFSLTEIKNKIRESEFSGHLKIIISQLKQFGEVRWY